MNEPRVLPFILGVALLLASSGVHSDSFADRTFPAAGDKVVLSSNLSGTSHDRFPRRYVQAPQDSAPGQFPQETYPPQSPDSSQEEYPPEYPDQSQQQYPPQYPDQYQQQYPPQYPDQYPQQYPQQYPPQYPQQPTEEWTPPDQWTPTPPPQHTSGCTVKLSKDRSTIHLLDATSGMERKHVSLGQDRVQRVFNSQDGAWSVTVFKIRGVSQYGFIAIDLARCEEQQPVDVPSVASAATFEPNVVVLTFERGKQRFPLRTR